jgi:hypothetical protein
MAKRGKHRGRGPDQPPPASGSGEPSADFPIHEHIGRSLKAMFEEVTAQPVPERLRRLLQELERKKTGDS